MKRSRYEDDSGTLRLVQGCGQKANKLPRSEVEKIISDKIGTAVEQSDYKIKNLMDRISEVNGEPRYEARIKKLEAHVRKIKRRGDAVFAFIRKNRSLGFSHSQSLPSLSPPSGQPQRCISPAESLINKSRISVNGESIRENTSVPSAVIDNDGDVTLKRPRKGFWQSLRSKKEIVDLTEDDRVPRLKEKSLVTRTSEQNLKPSNESTPSSTPPIAIKEENPGISEEDRVTSSVQLEEEDWQCKLHPFPDTPFPNELPVTAASYNLPQKPVVKLARIGSAQELGIAWNVEQKDPHVAEMDCYHTYMSHEHKDGTFSPWKCLGVIKAMALPMGCKLSACKVDKRLCFIVVGKDIFGRFGPYSDIRTVAPGEI